MYNIYIYTYIYIYIFKRISKEIILGFIKKISKFLVL